MKIKLSDTQKDQLDNLVDGLLHAITEDGVCEPDMSDIKEDDSSYDNVYEDRMNLLYVEALQYLKSNLL